MIDYICVCVYVCVVCIQEVCEWAIRDEEDMIDKRGVGGVGRKEYVCVFVCVVCVVCSVRA